jgi:hypothetical protein
VTAGKRLKSHDEPLMLIISGVGRYDMRCISDRWVMTATTWASSYWALLDGPEERFLSYWASSPDQNRFECVNVTKDRK